MFGSSNLNGINLERYCAFSLVPHIYSYERQKSLLINIHIVHLMSEACKKFDKPVKSSYQRNGVRAVAAVHQFIAQRLNICL